MLYSLRRFTNRSFSVKIVRLLERWTSWSHRGANPSLSVGKEKVFWLARCYGLACRF